ncbi:hypothetical protein LINGRAHAP2_LOCUS10193 [Linum grandiflorum]
MCVMIASWLLALRTIPRLHGGVMIDHFQVHPQCHYDPIATLEPTHVSVELETIQQSVLQLLAVDRFPIPSFNFNSYFSYA